MRNGTKINKVVGLGEFHMKKIANKAEYQDALKRAWDLMDAEAGSQDEQYLLALVKVIEDYEYIHYPIPVPGAKYV